MQRFDIVLNAAGAREAAVLETGYGPEWATSVFHEEWHRPMQDHVVGDRLLVHFGAGARTLLRERLVQAGPRSPHEHMHPHISQPLLRTRLGGNSAPRRTECCYRPTNLAQLLHVRFGQACLGGECG